MVLGAVAVDGEHAFLPDDMKLCKVAPQTWRDNKSSDMFSTFTLHFRVKYYVENISDIK